MASAELQTVLDLLEANPPVQGSDIPTMRKAMESMLTMMPPAEDMTFAPVDAGGVPAEWSTADVADTGRVVIYFHGGAYVMGSVATHRNLVAHIARRTGARVLSVDYRLGPEHPFPAAVDDAVASYRFVLASGVPAEKIAIAGDSAGGGLTAACLVALRDAGETMPGAAVCISPWLDLSQSFGSWQSKADVDPMLEVEQIQTCADAYLDGADPKTPTASPVFADLRGLSPLLVQVGTAETLLDESVEFAKRAKAAGVDASIDVAADMIHVWHAFADLLPEGREALDDLAAFLDVKLA
ncbi:MAG: alpha/beta hydrolase [Deltaproteobacteria bacterium]|nr:alpha/beta hydrolase [Deltaproteobacteria bacterium]